MSQQSVIRSILSSISLRTRLRLGVKCQYVTTKEGLGYQ